MKSTKNKIDVDDGTVAVFTLVVECVKGDMSGCFSNVEEIVDLAKSLGEVVKSELVMKKDTVIEID